jgi:hypothetical protein
MRQRHDYYGELFTLRELYNNFGRRLAPVTVDGIKALDNGNVDRAAADGVLTAVEARTLHIFIDSAN